MAVAKKRLTTTKKTAPKVTTPLKGFDIETTPPASPLYGLDFNKTESSVLLPDPLKFPGKPLDAGLEAKQLPQRKEPLFNQVQSNIKGGLQKTLAACTAFVGANRSGKTAVLDAVRLALTGKHPIGHTAADLAGLTTDGSLPFAHLSKDNVIQASLVFPEGKKTAVHTFNGNLDVPENAASMLPLSGLGDLLKLGTAKAREEIFRRFGAKDVGIAMPPEDDKEKKTESVESWHGLNKEQQGIYVAALTSDPDSNDDNVSRLTDAGEQLRSEKRTISSSMRSLEEERTRLRDDLAALGTSAPMRASELDLSSLRTQLAETQQAEKFSTSSERLKVVTADLNNALDALQVLPQPVSKDALQTQLDALPEVAEHAAKEAVHEAAVTALKNDTSPIALYETVRDLRQRMTQGADCTVCDRPAVPNSKELLARVEAGITMVAATSNKLHADVEVARQAMQRAAAADMSAGYKLTQAHTAQEAAYNAAISKAKALKAEYVMLTEFLKVAGVTTLAPEVSAASIQATLDEMTQANMSFDRIETIGADLRLAEASKNDVGVVEKYVSEMLVTMLQGVKVAAEAAVNQWMPVGFKASLLVSNDECRWEVFGTDSKAHPRGAASGAEWAALAAALACAWADGSIKVLLIDDADLAGFSADNVRSFLITVAKAVESGLLTQAVVAWSRPEEIPTEWWTVVTL